MPILGLLAAVAVLLALGYATIRETREQEEAGILVEHTHDVYESAYRIPSGVGAAESALRGYALQREVAFLEELEPAIRELEDAVVELRGLVAEDPAQRARVERLAPLVADRIRLFRQRLGLIQTIGNGEVSNEARRLTHEIRSLVAEIVAVEQKLLVVRSQQRDLRLRRLRMISPLGIGTSIVLAVAAFFLFDREARRRGRAERASEHQGARLRTLLRESELTVQLGELLAACRTAKEASDVVLKFGPKFFPQSSGAVAMLNESENLLEVHAAWGPATLVKNGVFEPDGCWALRRGKPHRWGAGADSVLCAHAQAELDDFVCVPLFANGEVIGTMHVTQPRVDEDEVQERRIHAVGEQVGMALSNLRLRDTLRNRSIRDPLTGLFNRRFTDETFQREVHRARREKSSVTVLAMDVDHFKKFNDTYGHPAGDRVLSVLGSLLLKRARASDVPSRLGGEELALLLPGASLADASRRAEELRAEVASLDIVHEGKSLGPVTLSIGVASYPDHGETPEDVFRVADAALYRAKREGRNRVVVEPSR